MQPDTKNDKTTVVISADAPEECEAMQKYMELSEENKERVNLYVQTLLREQYTP